MQCGRSHLHLEMTLVQSELEVQPHFFLYMVHTCSSTAYEDCFSISHGAASFSQIKYAFMCGLFHGLGPEI